MWAAGKLSQPQLAKLVQTMEPYLDPYGQVLINTNLRSMAKGEITAPLQKINIGTHDPAIQQYGSNISTPSKRDGGSHRVLLVT